MRLPTMKYADRISKTTQIQFGGLNHSEGIRDGELWDMRNLTSDHTPLLATRDRRILERQVDAPGGLFSRDGLCWVSGTDFYYKGEVKGAVTQGRKTFACLGAYIVIFPDKCYYNMDTNEFGSLEACWEDREIDISGSETDGTEQKGNCIYGREADWSKKFNPGDAVTIEGCTEIPGNNKTAIIKRIDGDYLYFGENTFTLLEGATEYTEQGEISIRRTVPDLDYVCADKNRLWGCKGDCIYASKLGSVFTWQNRDGISSDGYNVDTGSAGAFTGCCSFQGYPTFFKEDHIYKIYGAIPSEYQVIGSTALGLADGSSNSLAVVNGVLFYLGRNGIMAYSGGMPQTVGDAFGMKKFKDAVAGSDGLKYYVSMCDENGKWGLYVYDTQRGVWHREDEVQAVGFAWQDDNLHMLTEDGKLLIVGSATNPAEDAVWEEDIAWSAEFGDFTEDNPNKKSMGKIQIRMELEEGASAQVWIMYDSEGKWMQVGKAIGEAGKRSYYLPIIPRRADHYRLKITGTGQCRIYSLARESYAGSEFRSTKGGA